MNVREIADFLEKTWFERRGRNAALVVASAGLFPLLFVKLGGLVAILGTVVADTAIIGLWFWSRRPPVTPADKLGFLVSISCADDDESRKLQEDFIRPLRELIKSGATGSYFYFIELPQHLAANTQDMEQAQALRIKCRAHFMIFGRVRLREINGKSTHVLDLEGLVAHGLIPDHISKALAKEFSELMPRKLHVAAENDLLAFQFTSEWADAVARYIIGLASAFSGDLDYAEELFLDAKDRLHGKTTNFPIYLKLKERLPRRLSEIHEARALYAYYKWVESKEKEYLLQIEANLKRITPGSPESPQTLNLKAIVEFALRRNSGEAIALIKKIRHPNLAWHLNMAFLLGYQGELRNSIRHYRLAAQFEIIPETLAQVEDFTVWVVREEPNQFQLYFCLGFFNWKIKGDLLQAVRDFETFLSNITALHMQKEMELATKWIAEIRTGSAG